MFSLFLIFSLFVSAAAPPSDAPVDHAWSVLKDSLENKNADKRAKAVHALGLLTKNFKAQQCAEKALADDSAEVRAEAANALGLMGAVSARPKLREALNDKELSVVLAAANSLHLLKDPIAYEIFYSVLTGERKDAGLLHSQLNRFKDRKQVEKLAFETGIGFVPFGSMSYEAWKTVTHDTITPLRVAAAGNLASDPDPESAQALAKSCTDKKWQVRAASASAIAQRGDPALLKSVIPLLEDENDAVRSEAAAVVIRLSSAHPRAKQPR
jgi:HEAT repeat protein